MSINRLAVLQAFVQTRMLKRSLRTRADVARHQARLWRRLAPVLADTPALSAHAGKAMEAIPVIDAHEMRARPDAWNSLSLSALEIAASADAAERGEAGEVRSGIYAGYSTGSFGKRGMFLSSRSERARYLGQSLAKLLPDPAWSRRRIALCLRADNALYRDVASAGPFEFRFFSLTMPADDRAAAIGAFAPDIFVAPSHVLAELAARTTAGKFKPPGFRRLYYGAEPMGASERDWIEDALGVRPDPIYQATEGFLAAACSHGTLHLNEDSIAFGFEPIGSSHRVRAIITDLRRTSQPVVRVRLDDILQLREAACPCGSAMQAIEPVEGRVVDTWRWNETSIFPRDVETAVSAALAPSDHWRAIGSPAGVRLACDVPGAHAAAAMLSKMLADAGAPWPVTVVPFTPQDAPKRRRVQWIDD